MRLGLWVEGRWRIDEVVRGTVLMTSFAVSFQIRKKMFYFLVVDLTEEVEGGNETGVFMVFLLSLFYQDVVELESCLPYVYHHSFVTQS